MLTTFAPSELGLRLDFRSTLSIAIELGFEAIDFDLRWLADGLAPGRARETTEHARIAWGGCDLPLALYGDDAKWARDADDLPGMADALCSSGCTCAFMCLAPGDNALPWEANFERHMHRLADVAQVLASRRIQLALEFQGCRTSRDAYRHPFVHTLSQTVGLCDALAQHAGVDKRYTGVLLDMFHWYTSGSTLEDMVRHLRGDRVLYVHACDALPNLARENQVDGRRALPGATGVIDSRAFINGLRALNYRGPVAAEPFLEADDSVSPRSRGAAAATALRNLIEL